ncbi:MAG: Cysteine desulfurase IscS [Alphaproteobacteria bacterium MarineAlpha12_Bin1]|nr:MAG: Cysteine desulfurase IscS [Alphaproteobacteria bacterium MarineAlpha12_Bin1]
MENILNSDRLNSVESIYLDYQATTPVDPLVVEEMLPWLTEKFGNAHSSQHVFGIEAEAAVERARAKVAASIHATPSEIIFTSGATESNNLAIKGAARFALRHKAGNHIIILETEHKCVLESCSSLESEGINTTALKVGKDGLVNLKELEDAITEDTILISIMAVNNEIGVIHPLSEIGLMCRDRSILFHTDGAQAVGKIPINVDEMFVDLMSVSGHKLYAPKGIGVLYVRRRPRARLMAEISGGGQERGMRSGTLPVPLIVALGKACEIASLGMDKESKRLETLRDSFLAKLKKNIPDVAVNGSMSHRISGNLNITFPGVPSSSLIKSLTDVAISNGSACSSASSEPSYVLRALGITKELAACSVRIGFGRFTNEQEIEFALKRITEEVLLIRTNHEAAAE